MDKTISTVAASRLSELLLKDIRPRLIEPHIYSVLPDVEVANSYDQKFGTFYDWVACNPLYNRLVWGYSIARFASLVHDALTSSKSGCVLDLGCGSLAFTAKTYSQYSDRPIVLLDQSLKGLKIAKSRLIKLNGDVPSNMVFIHGDVLELPFELKRFHTIIALNLLHVLDDEKKALLEMKNALAENGTISLTTLVENKRIADRYLKLWENAGEVVSRNISQLLAIFNGLGIPAKYDINGNMAFIHLTTQFSN